jgi:hypothetical protein
MIPAPLIPIIIQIATKLIDYGFKKLESLPEDKKSKCLDKIEENDRKALEKSEMRYDHD